MLTLEVSMLDSSFICEEIEAIAREIDDMS